MVWAQQPNIIGNHSRFMKLVQLPQNIVSIFLLHNMATPKLQDAPRRLIRRLHTYYLKALISSSLHSVNSFPPVARCFFRRFILLHELSSITVPPPARLTPIIVFGNLDGFSAPFCLVPNLRTIFMVLKLYIPSGTQSGLRRYD